MVVINTVVHTYKVGQGGHYMLLIGLDHFKRKVSPSCAYEPLASDTCTLTFTFITTMVRFSRLVHGLVDVIHCAITNEVNKVSSMLKVSIAKGKKTS